MKGFVLLFLLFMHVQLVFSQTATPTDRFIEQRKLEKKINRNVIIGTSMSVIGGPLLTQYDSSYNGIIGLFVKSLTLVPGTLMLAGSIPFLGCMD